MLICATGGTHFPAVFSYGSGTCLFFCCYDIRTCQCRRYVSRPVWSLVFYPRPVLRAPELETDLALAQAPTLVQ